MNWGNLISIIFIINAIELSLEIHRMSCRRHAMFKISARNSKLDVIPISTKTMQHLSLCAKMCLGENTCKTLNYNAQLKSCEALSQTKQEAGNNKTTSANGWDYYEPVIYEVSYDTYF